MDLKPIEALPTRAEQEAVEELLGPLDGADGAWGGPGAWGGHGARGGLAATSGRRHLLLPALHAIQSRVGWISEGALGYVCRRLSIPPAEAYGVASFYALFALEPRAPVVAHVCDDIACMGFGICDSLGGSPVPEGTAWLPSPCLGQCDRAPAALVVKAGRRPVERTLTGLSSAGEVLGALASAASASGDGDGVALPGPLPPLVPQRDQPGAPELVLLSRVGHVDPASLDDYRAHGGYQALRRAFALGAEGVIREVSESRLLGRGGAAFPTGRKWEAVARAPERPHYLVCNADESEPGTFKDRVLMEQDPFAVVEAMTIAALATGCEKGYLYIRGEYPLAAARLEAALEELRRHGFLGKDIWGQGLHFDVEVRRGAGAYICGEETALFNSLEGYRGEPRNKPPFPVQSGLFGRPTVVNNVETLVNVLPILNHGAAWYAGLGTPQSTGTRLLCLSGAVARPGLYEVPHGMKLREVLELAGGVARGRDLQAILLGGAAGAFVGPSELDLELSFEATRAAGVTLGSGVVMAFDDAADLGVVLARVARFFRDESCGQCVPCRVGTVRQEELLHRLAAGQPLGSPDQELALLSEVAAVMRDASICGLGQTAASAITSAVDRRLWEVS
jgi:NADH-quinone oxidoreductase subunit F